MSRYARCMIVVAVLLAALSAKAEEASLTLSTDVAVWNDIVTARIEGVGGCELASPPDVHFQSGLGWAIDIDLDCASGPVEPVPFSTAVEIGPLADADYTVRVFNAIRHIVTPPPPPLDTASLRVYREASVDIDLPEDATDAAAFPLVFSGPAYSSCYSFDPPVVDGRTITATFVDQCPILPIPGPVLFTQEHEVGPLQAGEYDVRVFEYALDRPRLRRETLTVHDADGCVPSSSVLCLQDGRFRVAVDWMDFENNTGSGQALPLANGDDSGLFWFFRKENVELTVKVLDGCGVNGHWWAFLSSGSTVEYTVTVTDTRTNETNSYRNELHEAAALVADTSAFSCAP